jgi:hypothetical protein
MPMRSFLSQPELPAIIGLGYASKLESLEILWPGGSCKGSKASRSIE